MISNITRPEDFHPLPLPVDSTRRKSVIRWQKRAAVWEHGFESRWGHHFDFVDVSSLRVSVNRKIHSNPQSVFSAFYVVSASNAFAS